MAFPMASTASFEAAEDSKVLQEDVTCPDQVSQIRIHLCTIAAVTFGQKRGQTLPDDLPTRLEHDGAAAADEEVNGHAERQNLTLP